MTCHNFRDIKPKDEKKGILEYEILKPQETFSKILSAKILTIDYDKKTSPKKFHGDIMYFVLGGKANITIQQLQGDWDYALSSEWSVWIPPMSNYTIKNVGDMPLRMIEFSSKISEDEDISDITNQHLIKVVNRFHCPLDYFIHYFQHTLFAPTPEAKKLYFGGYHTIYPGGYLPRHVENLDCEETMYVTRGQGRMSSGDNNYNVTPGSVVYVPPKTYHDIQNTSDNEYLEVLLYESHS
jgi:mannose-6-phosphate isomerase-like protein (cupin superfamily)